MTSDETKQRTSPGQTESVPKRDPGLRVTRDIRRAAQSVIGDTRYVELAIEFLESTGRHRRSSTAKDLLRRVAFDTAFKKSPWVEYRSRTVLAAKLGCQREELNRAIDEVRDEWTDDQKQKRCGKKFLKLVETGRRLRFWPQWDEAFWNSTRVLPDDVVALAERDPVRTIDDDKQPDMIGFPSHVFDDIDETRLMAEIDKRLACSESIAAAEPSENPTVPIRPTPPAAIVPGAELSGKPTVSISTPTVDVGMPSAQPVRLKAVTTESSEKPTVHQSYSYSKVQQTGISTSSLGVQLSATAITDENFKKLLLDAQPGPELFRLCLWFFGDSVRRSRDGRAVNYTYAWRKYCQVIPQAVKDVVSGLFSQLSEGKKFGNRASVAYENLVTLGHLSKEC